jgi:hypothetical protein
VAEEVFGVLDRSFASTGPIAAVAAASGPDGLVAVIADTWGVVLVPLSSGGSWLPRVHFVQRAGATARAAPVYVDPYERGVAPPLPVPQPAPLPPMSGAPAYGIPRPSDYEFGHGYAYRAPTSGVAIPGPKPVVPETVRLNVGADIAGLVEVGRITSVRCRVSHGVLAARAGWVNDMSAVAADVSRRLVLQVIPKTNADVVGEDRVDLAVPAPGEMYDLYFDVRATHAGACEVWIVVRQGPMPLATLRLRTRAAPNGDRPLVVLNACQVGRAGARMSSLGGFAQAFLNRGAGAFISGMWSIGDQPASTFMTTLYGELLKGRPMSQAATRAREKARRAGDGTWLAYAVYAHPLATLSVTARGRR